METDGADKTTALEKLFEVGIVKKALYVIVKLFLYFFFRVFFCNRPFEIHDSKVGLQA